MVILRVDSDAVVFDRTLDHVVGLAGANADQWFGLRAHELGAVFEQVLEYLDHSHVIAPETRQVVIDLDADTALVEQVAYLVDRLLDDPLERSGLWRVDDQPDPAQFEQPFQQLAHVVRGLADFFEILHDLVELTGLDVFLQQPDKTLGRDQWRAQLV